MWFPRGAKIGSPLVGLSHRSGLFGFVSLRKAVRSDEQLLLRISREAKRPSGSAARHTSLSAGPFLTDIAEAWPEEQRNGSPNAVGPNGNPEEVVTAALFLASPHSSYVDVAIVRCDGGLHLGQ
jgi:hypothetical protein